ncbi:AB hydrolase superfamily protein [Abortiporus biennis]
MIMRDYTYDGEGVNAEGLVDQVPLVIVEGFFGSPSAALWGDFEHHHRGDDVSESREIIYATISPVGSLHDRACELYHLLKGGVVDYGEDHSVGHNHARYGRDYGTGMYPQWSREKPLHFLGHSLGGATITKLQWLLKTGFFGKTEHPDQVLSLTTVSTPFRGSPIVYLLGHSTSGGPGLQTFSFGWALAKSIHIANYLKPLLPFSYDLFTETRPMSFLETSFNTFIRRLWHSDWTEGRDIAYFDTTFEAVDEREAQLEGETNPNTFYRSYSASMTRRRRDDAEAGFHQPSKNQMTHSPHLFWLSSSMGCFDFSKLGVAPSFLPRMEGAIARKNEDVDDEFNLAADEDDHPHEAFYANDGVVPVFSQWHPFECKRTRCKHYGRSRCCEFDNQFPVNSSSNGDLQYCSQEELRPGMWHVYHLDDTNHHDIVPIWTGSSRQKVFWKELGQWLRGVDATRASSTSDLKVSQTARLRTRHEANTILATTASMDFDQPSTQFEETKPSSRSLGHLVGRLWNSLLW